MNFWHHVHDEMLKFLATHNTMPIQAFIIAFIVAICRTGKQGAINWFEATLCGVFTAIAINVPTLLNFILPIPIPVDFSTLTGAAALAGFIGWNGTDKVVSMIKDKFLGNKKDDKNEDNSKGVRDTSK